MSVEFGEWSYGVRCADGLKLPPSLREVAFGVPPQAE